MFQDKRRGDVYWMQDSAHKPQDTRLIRGDRPVIVVSSDSANQAGSTVIVIPRSCSPAQMAREGTGDRVPVATPGRHGGQSMALTQQMHAVDTADLIEYIGHLTDAEMARVDAALHRALGL